MGLVARHRGGPVVQKQEQEVGTVDHRVYQRRYAGVVECRIAYLRRHSFKLFAVYRFVVGGGILLVILLGLRHAGGI